MTRLGRSLATLFTIALIAAGSVARAEPPPPGDKDPIRAVLLESRERNRGVTLHANGANISMVVTSLDALHVIGRSQQTSRIVVRLDRIDGVSAMF